MKKIILQEYFDLKPDQAFLISQKALIINENKLLILKGVLGRQIDGEFVWELPGGLLEYDEDIEKGLIREVYEETGLNIVNPEIFDITSYSKEKKFVFKDKRQVKVKKLVTYYLCQTRQRLK